MEELKEIWRTIFLGSDESQYQISNFGRVKSLKRRNEKITKSHKDRLGYLHSDIRINKRAGEHGKRPLTRRLVAMYFIDNPNGYKEINHIDGNKENNHVSNLEWCSRQHNIQHAVRTGLMKYNFRTNHHGYRSVRATSLDGSIVKDYELMTDAEKEGFNQGDINYCCQGKRKRHKGFTWSYIN